MNTIIRGGRLLDIGRHAAEPADILVERDTVREIGPPGMAAPGDAATLDASGRMLMPGLVNAHTHGHNNLAKSVGDRWTLELLLNAAPWITGGRTLEDKYLSTLIGAVEMVRKGCTAAYDLSFEFPAPTPEGLEAIGQAYADTGMRAVVAPMMADRTFHRAIPGLLDALPASLRREAEAVSLEPFETSMAAWERARSAWPFGRDRVRLALAPTIPHHCSEEFLRVAHRAGAEHGVGFHTHLAESKVQALAGMRLYGKTQTAWLDSLGVLDPRFTAAHAVWLDRDDMRRLADAGAAVAHNPGSNARLGNGLAAARALLDAGVRVGIGTDACTCSDNLNMFEAMRIASMVSRVQELDYERWLATGEILDMATRGSAGVLGIRRRNRGNRARAQGRYRVPRSRPCELRTSQRSSQSDRARRGWDRGRVGHDRRPHGARRTAHGDRGRGEARPGRGGGGRAARRGQRRHEGDDGAARKRGRALWRGVVAGGLPYRTPRPLHDLDGFAETGFTLLSPMHSQFSGFCERAEWIVAQLFSLVNLIEHGIFHSQENPDFSGTFILSGRYGP